MYLNPTLNPKCLLNCTPDNDWEKFDTVAPKLIKWRMEGKIKFHEDIQKGGPANYLNSLRRLFTGANTGKLILSMY